MNKMGFLYTIFFVGLSMVGGYFIPRMGFKLLHYRQIATGRLRFVSWYPAFWSGLGAWIVYNHFQQPFDRILSLFFLFLLLLIAWIDLHTGYIFNQLTYGGYVILLVVQLLRNPADLPRYLLMSLVIYTVFYVIAKGTKGIGQGDAKLVAMCSLIMDWQYIILAVWIASLSGLCYAAFYHQKYRNIHRKIAMPFGPHLAFGLFFVYLFGEQVFHRFFYLHSFYQLY